MDTVINSRNESIKFENSDNHCQSAITQENTIRKSHEEISLVPKSTGKEVEVDDCKYSNISVEDAVAHFKTLNLPKDLNRLQPDRIRFSELLRFLKPPPKLQQSLALELDFIYSLTQCSLNWLDQVQCRMLQTLYKKLTGATIDCPLRGTHWQIIGFQGNDPATDLRGVGLFGLLQFLFLTSDKMLPLGQKLFTVANSENQPFPLAVLSLNITNIVLNVMTSGKLNRECNMRNSVLDVLNSFYGALLVYVLSAWISQNKTIKDSGYLLKDAERYCSRNARRVLKDLPQNLLKYKQ